MMGDTTGFCVVISFEMWEETKNKISQKKLTRLVMALPIVLFLVARAENNATPHSHYEINLTRDFLPERK
jgi:hypothetical protein